jgi:hypothetical protein
VECLTPPALVLRWSRSFRSSSDATISAAPPLGHRMMGKLPRVAHTLKSPATISATAAVGKG